MIGTLGKFRIEIRSGLKSAYAGLTSLLHKFPFLYPIYSALSWILLAGFLLSLFFIEDSRDMLLQFGWSYYVLLRFWLLCRSKTLTWRMFSYFFLAGAWLTVPINTMIVNAVTNVFGGRASDIWSTAIVTPIAKSS